MKNIVCLLEEPSAKEMLEAILPQIIDNEISIHYVVFEGKNDLEKKIIKRIRHWQKPDSYFLIMRDKDSGDCIDIKSKLKDKVLETGKSEQSIIRIACHELESFYLGDLKAVELGLNIPRLSKIQSKKQYRSPDNLANPAQELIRLSKNNYQKIAGSRSIAPHLKIDGSNKSHSFNVLISGIKTLLK
ncbi:MAG: DUF4276 family protein [Deltaproteobacteria bacterium]|nr:DUF4276 family protein [Deltaproteobacteria bacterium]